MNGFKLFLRVLVWVGMGVGVPLSGNGEIAGDSRFPLFSWTMKGNFENDNCVGKCANSFKYCKVPSLII